MRKGNILRFAAVLCLCILCVNAGCGAGRSSSKDSGETLTDAGSESASQVDIISEVQKDAQDKSIISKGLTDETMKSKYQQILDGTDSGRYYIQDINGDGVPELIVGSAAMTVYTYKNGDIATLGTIEGFNVYYSDKYGILAEKTGDGRYVLSSYSCSGSLLNKTDLVSAGSADEYSAKAADILKASKALTGFDIKDRSVFAG